MNAKIVVTGFKPFSVYSVNSSWESAKRLQQIKEHIIIKELTVDYIAAYHEISSLLESHEVDILLLSGLADYNHIKLESIANKPMALNFVEGPNLLYGNWPLKETLISLRSNNIPASISNDAGKYVCESIYWSALNFMRSKQYPKFVVFMHVPTLSDIWTKNRIAKAMEIAIETAKGFLLSSGSQIYS